jgi:hypothetical protein
MTEQEPRAEVNPREQYASPKDPEMDEAFKAFWKRQQRDFTQKPMCQLAFKAGWVSGIKMVIEQIEKEPTE